MVNVPNGKFNRGWKSHEKLDRTSEAVCYPAVACSVTSSAICACFVGAGNHGRSSRYGERSIGRRDTARPCRCYGTTLVGSKEVLTDSSGYYRFANLPPGLYTLTVTAEGFETLKHEKLALEVGHVPTVELTLHIGKVNTVVEVSTEAPQIDTTTTENMTNIPQEELKNTPTASASSRSFSMPHGAQ